MCCALDVPAEGTAAKTPDDPKPASPDPVYWTRCTGSLRAILPVTTASLPNASATPSPSRSYSRRV